MVDYIDTVINYFHRMKIEYSLVRKSSSNIRKIELFHQQPLESGVLYVTSEWSGKIPDGISLLVITEDLQQDWSESENSNLILVFTSLPPEQLVSLLSIWMESYIRNYDSVVRQRLVKYMASKDSLNSIVELASEWMENPVAVMDMSHNALAWMQPPVCPEELKDLFRNMQPSENLLYTIVTSGHSILNQLLSRKAAIMTPKGLPRNYICLIFVKDIAIAGISVMELNRPFEDSDYQKIQFLSTLLAQELQKTKYNTINRVHRQRSFFYDILRDNSMNETDLNERMQYFQLPLKQYNYLLAVDSRSMPKEEQEQLVNEMSILRGDLAVLFDGYVVLLVTSNELIGTRSLQGYIDFLTLRGLRAGLSTGFTKLTYSKLYFLQATSAIIWGDRLGQEHTIFCYDDYALNHIISLSEPASDLMHPAIRELAAYDTASDACLCATLYQYLKYDRSIAMTAHTMHVHRNTINSRIGKVKRMLPIDWEDPAQIGYLFLSLVVLEGKKPELFNRM